MSGSTSVLQIARDADNIGLFEWDIPSGLRGDLDYYLYIKALDDSVEAQSEIFAIIPDISVLGSEIYVILTVLFLVSLCLVIVRKRRMSLGGIN